MTGCRKCHSQIEPTARFCSRCGELQASGEPVIVETGQTRINQLKQLIRQQVCARAKWGDSWGRPYYETLIFRRFYYVFRIYQTVDFRHGWADLQVAAENEREFKFAFKFAHAYMKLTGKNVDVLKKF